MASITACYMENFQLVCEGRVMVLKFFISDLIFQKANPLVGGWEFSCNLLYSRSLCREDKALELRKWSGWRMRWGPSSMLGGGHQRSLGLLSRDQAQRCCLWRLKERFSEGRGPQVVGMSKEGGVMS